MTINFAKVCFSLNCSSSPAGKRFVIKGSRAEARGRNVLLRKKICLSHPVCRHRKVPTKPAQTDTITLALLIQPDSSSVFRDLLAVHIICSNVLVGWTKDLRWSHVATVDLCGSSLLRLFSQVLRFC